jgi:hypothetical protein
MLCKENARLFHLRGEICQEQRKRSLDSCLNCIRSSHARVARIPKRRRPGLHHFPDIVVVCDAR